MKCLKNGEILITIEEKLIRLKRDKSGYIRYGATVFKGLWDDYQAREKDSVLETLYCEKSITRLDFPGDVLAQAPYGCRHVLCLYRDGGGWYWLADGGCTDYLSAVSQVPPKAGQVAS